MWIWVALQATEYASADVQQDTELLNFSASSLIAEVGGILGLFIGFSFIGLWDCLTKFFKI